MAYPTMTDAEIQAQAANEYQSYYDKLRLSAQQNVASTDLLLQQQIGGLGTTYGKQLEASQKDYAQGYSQSAREQLARGMGRSSYALQTLANVNQSGAEAKQTIMDAKGAAEANLAAQRTQLQSQLAAQMMNYDASQSADILKRIGELQTTQYERQYQTGRDAASDAQWQAEFNETVRQFNESLAAQREAAARSSGGGSSGGSSQGVTTPSGMTLEQLIASLSGGESTKKSLPMTQKQASLTSFGTRKQTKGILTGKSSSSSVRNKLMQMTK
jgi:hypothetical protein